MKSLALLLLTINSSLALAETNTETSLPLAGAAVSIITATATVSLQQASKEQAGAGKVLAANREQLVLQLADIQRMIVEAETNPPLKSYKPRIEMAKQIEFLRKIADKKLTEVQNIKQQESTLTKVSRRLKTGSRITGLASLLAIPVSYAISHTSDTSLNENTLPSRESYKDISLEKASN